VKSAVAGLAVAVIVGYVWGLFPGWNFYLALILGFGVAESMAWAANYKRGSDLQLLGVVFIVVGLAVSRVVIAQQHPFLSLDDLLNHATSPVVAEAFQIRLIPDFLFAGIAMAIPFVRFR
jgi:hypothetical protein